MSFQQITGRQLIKYLHISPSAAFLSLFICGVATQILRSWGATGAGKAHTVHRHSGKGICAAQHLLERRREPRQRSNATTAGGRLASTVTHPSVQSAGKHLQRPGAQDNRGGQSNEHDSHCVGCHTLSCISSGHRLEWHSFGGSCCCCCVWCCICRLLLTRPCAVRQ